MSTAREVRQAIATSHIIADMAFLRRFGEDLRGRQQETAVPVMSFTSYIFLLVHESARYIRRLGPEYAMLTEVVHAAQIEAGRHSIKIFDDTERGYAGVTEFFESGVIPAERRYFIDKVRFKLGGLLGNDLGIYTYDGKVISTTHTLQFSWGLQPGTREAQEWGPMLFEASRQCGQYVAAIADNVDWRGPSFLNALDLAKIKNRDTVAAKYYKRSFDQIITEGLSATLTAVMANLNVLNSLISLDHLGQSAPTISKLHYITLRHATRALQEVRSRYHSSLSDYSLEQLSHALDNDPAREVTQADDPGLRNSLLHYGISKRTPVDKLSVSRPLYGLVETFFPNLTFETFRQMVLAQSERLSAILNTWAGPG